MKKTTLSGSGDAGEIEIVIQTTPGNKGEDGSKHDWLVERVHNAMSDSGCFSQKIEVCTDEEEEE